MNTLTPLQSLFDMEHGRDLPLPSELAILYGRLAFTPHPGRAHIVGNFVTTLDGVVTLNESGHASGGDISGFNRHDQLVMGLLRAVADAVIVGAGTLRDELFLTLAPQIAGRDAAVERPGLVSGKRFAPAHPLWGTLISVKREGSHLFLRYAFQTREDA